MFSDGGSYSLGVKHGSNISDILVSKGGRYAIRITRGQTKSGGVLVHLYGPGDVFLDAAGIPTVRGHGVDLILPPGTTLDDILEILTKP
jgi:hypothetical protein